MNKADFLYYNAVFLFTASSVAGSMKFIFSSIFKTFSNKKKKTKKNRKHPSCERLLLFLLFSYWIICRKGFKLQLHFFSYLAVWATICWPPKVLFLWLITVQSNNGPLHLDGAGEVGVACSGRYARCHSPGLLWIQIKSIQIYLISSI